MSQAGKPRQIQIAFPEADLDRLQAKLDDARLPAKPIVEGIKDPKEYGTDLTDLERFLSHWRSGNPEDSQQRPLGEKGRGVKAWWRSVEAQLNKYPHYQVEIEGVTVHYQHFKPKEAPPMPPIPLIFSHGWPGAFTEASHFAARLVENRSPAFEVVVPSLPGYGLSSQPPREGWQLTDTARVFNTLMTSVLGYSAYMAQGGDWGTVVSRCLSVYPACKIYHTNFAPPTSMPTWVYPLMAVERLSGFQLTRHLGLLGYTDAECSALLRSQDYITKGNAYLIIQNSRPATLGYALYDEPVGILAWFLEKFKDWSDPRCPAFAERGKGNRESEMTEESVLIDVMIYYLTGSIHTSFLPYKESAKLCWFPRSSFNLVHFRQHEYGGHFAALDHPQALVEDVVDFANEHWPRPQH
ncbi:related to Epoxide hydrolase 1 [Pseudozyma flocculosa]|uniref:Related to Epoxide hydrolase 1 n=1 Tax=Pseudozyma flocculosa TaxID=84751 RepID=A0A5C3FAV8_9BASI|nr:related to Epoxide hydrolase 1 [Pseudozyma flocculosa]